MEPKLFGDLLQYMAGAGAEKMDKVEAENK